MNIPKKKLVLFGISIKVNRKAKLKETKSGKWNQEQFADGICSQNTLIRIEHGKTSRYIEVYEEAAERLHLKLGYFPDIEKQINYMTPRLYKAVEFYDLKKINFYTTKLLECLEPVKEYLWYCDLYEVTKVIIDYYNKDISIADNLIDKYIDVCEEFNESIRTILKTIIFSSICNLLHNKKVSYSDVDRVYDELDLINSTSASNLINTLLYCLMSEKTTQLLIQFNKLEMICCKTENYMRLLDGYSIAISYLSVMDRHEVENYINRFEILLSKVKVPQIKLKDYYFGLGAAWHEKGRYDKAVEYFKKLSGNETKKHYISFIYLASAQKKLGLPIDIPCFSDEDLNDLPEDMRYIYEYYKMGEDIPAFIKQRYIMEEILPRLSDKDEAVIGIIRDELLCLIEESNHYKDAVLFDIKCKELLKN